MYNFTAFHYFGKALTYAKQAFIKVQSSMDKDAGF